MLSTLIILNGFQLNKYLLDYVHTRAKSQQKLFIFLQFFNSLVIYDIGKNKLLQSEINKKTIELIKLTGRMASSMVYDSKNILIASSKDQDLKMKPR